MSELPLVVTAPDNIRECWRCSLAPFRRPLRLWAAPACPKLCSPRRYVAGVSPCFPCTCPGVRTTPCPPPVHTPQPPSALPAPPLPLPSTAAICINFVRAACCPAALALTDTKNSVLAPDTCEVGHLPPSTPPAGRNPTRAFLPTPRLAHATLWWCPPHSCLPAPPPPFPSCHLQVEIPVRDGNPTLAFYKK